MAVGDILTFGTLRWYTSEGTYYDVKQLPSMYFNKANYSSFKFVETSDVSYQWKWIEARINNRKVYICKTIPFTFEVKTVDDIKQTVRIGNTNYALKLISANEFRALPSTVLNQIDFNCSEINNGYKSFYVGTSTIKYIEGYSLPNRVFLGRTREGEFEEILKTDYEIDNSSGSYFYYEKLGFLPILEEVKNPPTISGDDRDLGSKSSAFSVTYSVTTDNAADEVLITERLNGNVIRTLKNPSQGYQLSADINSALFSSLNAGVVNVLEIEAKNNDASAYRRYTFTKVNSGPIITLTGAEELGELTSKPTIKYSVSDNEGDEVTVKEYLNGTLMKTFTATLGAENTITFTDDFWITCNSSLNTIAIAATDSNGTTTYKYVTFSRKVNKIQFTTKNAIQTSAAASKIMVTPQWNITNATGKVEVCNNGFDSSPTWEDMTAKAVAGEPYTFTNSTKTAANWGIKIRITITKNEGATNEVAIYGFGGAYQ